MQPVTKTKETGTVDERIRLNLVRFIEESEYSQQSVADMAGIPQANLGRYCRGENAVPAAALPMLAQVFGRSVADFFTPEPPPADIESAPPVFIKLRPGVVLTDEDQRDVEDLLKRMRDRRIKKRPTKKG